MTGLLQRSIMWELLRVFAISLVALTGLLVLGGVVAEAAQRGLAPSQILTLVPLMIPSFLPYTIPATTLFATCNVYGRLAKDNEITALRSAGVNVAVILRPALILGLIAAASTMFLYYQVIPMSFQRVREHLVRDVNEFLTTLLKRQGCVKDSRLPYAIFTREVQGDRLVDVIFKRGIPQSHNYDTIARAKDARIRVENYPDPDTGRNVDWMIVEMTQCVVYSQGPDDDRPTVVQFQSREFREKLPVEVFGSKDSPRSSDVTWPRLIERTEALRQRELQRAADIADFNKSIRNKPALSEHEKNQVQAFIYQQRYGMREYRSFQAEQHLRPALAVGCLCFVLLGAPIGIWASRADFLSSFVIGFLPAVLLYYPILIALTNLAKEGKMSIPVAIWTADGIFLTIAATLCWRVIRR